jgi:hypothetical protein
MKKYGRTFHFPMSPGATNDDKILRDLSALEVADEVIATEKMDGENTTIHSGGTHARSIDGRHHPSRDRMKAFAAGISPMLADNERIVGENLYARHSIAYDALPHFFMGFAWIVDGVFQDWDATTARFEELGITQVPVLWRGKFSMTTIESLVRNLNLERQEGLVTRVSHSFHEDEMGTHMAKYVREGHVTSDKHWMHQEVVPNGLKL